MHYEAILPPSEAKIENYFSKISSDCFIRSIISVTVYWSIALQMEHCFLAITLNLKCEF